MEIQNKVVVVTGGGSGIGEALVRRFAAEGAAGILVADVDAARAEAVAGDLGELATAMHVDVGTREGNEAMIARAEDEFGPVDLLCLNAGVAIGGGVDAPDEDWETSWNVNLMAHVWAVRAVLPSMLERGEGYLLHTASAAGLLTNIGAAPYSVTKHGVVALAEWLSMTHGDRGLKVSALCPQFVRTPMLEDFSRMPGGRAMAEASAITVEDVAAAVVQGLADERFLILPHPEVRDYVLNKANDHDRWLAAMRRLQAKVTGG